MVETSSRLLLVNGLGAVVGSLLASPLMAWQGPQALLVFIAVVNALFLVFIFYRMRRRPPANPEDRVGFELSATEATVAAIDPSLELLARSPKPNEDNG